MRRAASVDRNQPEIVEALRAAGETVLLLHRVGSGCPDVLSSGAKVCPTCGNGLPYNFLIEIKDGSKVPSKQKLTADEATFFEKWRGQVEVATSIEEALRIVGRM